MNMTDTQPKKRTRIENFTPLVAKQMILEKKAKEADKYGVTTIMQNYILENMDPSRNKFDIYVSTMVDLLQKNHPGLSEDYIHELCNNAINDFRTQGWLVTYYRPVCYDQFDDGKAPHWEFKSDFV